MSARGEDRAGIRNGNGRLSDILTDRLSAMIASGELAGGERLPTERELMQRFGVSRSGVREAIANLASRGLLLTRSGYRPIVRRPDYDAALETLGHFVGHLLRDERGVWNLFESRIFVEAALVRHAAAHAKREDVEELRRALERSHAAIGDSEAFYATDVAFHGVLYRIPRNPIYPAIQKAYVAWLMDHWREMKRSPDVDRLNHAGHVAIVEAIVARDPDEAEGAMRRHLQVAWELVRGTFVGRDTGAERDPAPSWGAGRAAES
jgi:GntR family transcriptional regulator, sialic acid-inducible nan operon repressor